MDHTKPYSFSFSFQFYINHKQKKKNIFVFILFPVLHQPSNETNNNKHSGVQDNAWAGFVSARAAMVASFFFCIIIDDHLKLALLISFVAAGFSWSSQFLVAAASCACSTLQAVVRMEKRLTSETDGTQTV